MKVILTLVFILIASASFSQDLGKNFPADYPADLPKPKITVYNGSEPVDKGTVFMFDTDQTVKDAFNFFTAEMPKAGYKVYSEPLLSGDTGGSGLWEKDDKIVTLLVMKPEGFEQTSISISITSK
ncbi:MAG: hypothetical protein JST55_15420 [Bacteroidetes bacterium]|nr:hypothetical protein [Bacteroidota bacterium]